MKDTISFYEATGSDPDEVPLLPFHVPRRYNYCPRTTSSRKRVGDLTNNYLKPDKPTYHNNNVVSFKR